MKVPAYLLPHRALRYIRLGATAHDEVWSSTPLVLRCRVTAATSRGASQESGRSSASTVTTHARTHTMRTTDVVDVGDRVVWDDITFVVSKVTLVVGVYGDVVYREATLT